MRRLPLILLVIAAVLCACRRTPSDVISPKEMAKLLADIHVAESVVDNNQSTYSSDSMKKLLKQSVFAAHGVTQEEFDTSLVWYGHNLNVYIDVYDDVLKILEKRNQDIGNAVVELRGSMSGDSVDVWPGSKYAPLNKRMASKFVKFELQSDNNWEPGDIYTWRMKLLDDNNNTVKWTIVAEYDDNSTDWLYSRTSDNNWNEVVFASDSTLRLKTIRGYFEVVSNTSDRYDYTRSTQADATIWVDSISLIRKRLNPEDYRNRYRLRHHEALGTKKEPKAETPSEETPLKREKPDSVLKNLTLPL